MTTNAPQRVRHPLAGLFTGCALLASCLVLPVDHLVGQLSLGGPLLMASINSRQSLKRRLSLVAATVTVYLPMLLVLPPGSVLQGGTATFVAVSSLGMMGYPALHDAVARCPIPGVVKPLLLQILHQSSVLVRETAKIREAMVVRGAVAKGLAGWHILHALPRVWVPRVIFKADRVARAMEVRGYGVPVPPRPMPWTVPDIIATSVAAAVLATAISIRWTLR
jgi:hypothetical protein